jgi:molybdopterin-guanine dinucleotide biosynthesis protein A
VAIRKLLEDETGGRRMISFLDDVDTARVPEEDIRKIDPEIRSFFNVNTPYDLEAARHLLGDGS